MSYLCRRNKVLKIIENIGGRCVEDSNPSGLNPVAQMVEHTSTNLYLRNRLTGVVKRCIVFLFSKK